MCSVGAYLAPFDEVDEAVWFGPQLRIVEHEDHAVHRHIDRHHALKPGDGTMAGFVQCDSSFTFEWTHYRWIIDVFICVYTTCAAPHARPIAERGCRL